MQSLASDAAQRDAQPIVSSHRPILTREPVPSRAPCCRSRARCRSISKQPSPPTPSTRLTRASSGMDPRRCTGPSRLTSCERACADHKRRRSHFVPVRACGATPGRRSQIRCSSNGPPARPSRGSASHASRSSNTRMPTRSPLLKPRRLIACLGTSTDADTFSIGRALRFLLDI